MLQAVISRAKSNAFRSRPLYLTRLYPRQVATTFLDVSRATEVGRCWPSSVLFRLSPAASRLSVANGTQGYSQTRSEANAFLFSPQGWKLTAEG